MAFRASSLYFRNVSWFATGSGSRPSRHHFVKMEEILRSGGGHRNIRQPRPPAAAGPSLQTRRMRNSTYHTQQIWLRDGSPSSRATSCSVSRPSSMRSWKSFVLRSFICSSDQASTSRASLKRRATDAMP